MMKIEQYALFNLSSTSEGPDRALSARDLLHGSFMAGLYFDRTSTMPLCTVCLTSYSPFQACVLPARYLLAHINADPASGFDSATEYSLAQ